MAGERTRAGRLIGRQNKKGTNMECEGCGSCGPKKNTATYICKGCGKEEEKEVHEGQQVKSCCGKPMDKKE